MREKKIKLYGNTLRITYLLFKHDSLLVSR